MLSRFISPHFKRSIKKIMGYFILAIALFYLIAIMGHNPHDISLFFKSTDPIIAHIFGSFGAHTAALLLFILGGIGSLSCILFLLLLGFFLLRQSPLKQYADQLIGAFFFIFCSCSYAAFFKIDIGTFFCGGLCGVFLIDFFQRFFDSFLFSVFIFFITTSAFILMSRLVLIKIVIRAQVMMRRLALYHDCKAILASSYENIQIYLKKFISKVSALIFTNERMPSVIDLEYEKIPEEDAFWDKFECASEAAVQEPTLMESAPIEEKNEMPSLIAEPPKKISYALPLSSLVKVEQENHDDAGEQKEWALILEEKLERFGIHGKVLSIKKGPVITLFEYEPQIDSKISKIIALEDDLALALQAISIRIIAPIPGRSVVGFEVSNKKRHTVQMGSLLQSADFKHCAANLPLAIGQDNIGSNIIVDLTMMPHLLIAGSTGSGKSVALNTMLISLLYKCVPNQLKLILIDPKRLEFASYADIPHLLFPIITDPKKAAAALRWVVKTMEERYAIMEAHNVRNIFDYNRLVGKDTQKKAMPFIVIMIDELSDLMMTAPRETEDLIARIAQMARAAGIHMIIATQRPSVDVITGLIKVNFPSRISFRVTSKIDSRTILDCTGADKLLGKGDMLFLDSASRLIRAHAPYISDKEIGQVVNHIRLQQAPEYIPLPEDNKATNFDDNDIDEQLYDDVLRFIEMVDEVSISLLQRKFRIGYNRSARIIDKLESQGIIMQEPGGKTRKVIR